MIILTTNAQDAPSCLNWILKCHNVSFISLMNVAGALHGPNGKTRHSYRSSLVLKVVFHSPTSSIWISIWIWWYPQRNSNLENTEDPWIQWRISLNLDIEKWYLTIILLIARLSIHILHVPSFFLTIKVGRTQGLILGRISYFYNKSATIWCKILCSFGFIR